MCICVSLHYTTAVKNQSSTHNLHCMRVVNVFTITLNVCPYTIICVAVRMSRCYTLDAFCWLAWGCNTMVTGNGGDVNGLRGEKCQPSAFSQTPPVECVFAHDATGTDGSHRLVRAELRQPLWDTQMRFQVTGDQGAAWCKSGKTWTHPEGKLRK